LLYLKVLFGNATPGSDSIGEYATRAYSALALHRDSKLAETYLQAMEAAS